ncbi:MAG TPA: hypothetical protein DEH78_02110 [Solibacterales bacterium]|nr:hypothetical protein [Bryobacterales bacterium]
MRTQRPVALVGSGPAELFNIVRRASVLRRLGPVKSTSLRLASRMANTLRHGHAVREYEELADAGTTLLCMPEEQLAQTVAELAEAEISWRSRVVILCGGPPGSEALAPLARLGASVASLCEIPDLTPARFLAEGDRAALRESKRLFCGDGARLLEIEKGAKTACIAGFALLASRFPPLIDEVIRQLAAAGLSRSQAAPIVERMLVAGVRGYFRGGRRISCGPAISPP